MKEVGGGDGGGFACTRLESCRRRGPNASRFTLLHGAGAAPEGSVKRMPAGDCPGRASRLVVSVSMY